MGGRKRQTGRFSWRAIIRSPLSLISTARQKYSSCKEATNEVDHVVDVLDSSIKNVKGYRKQLRPMLHRCHEHCKNIVTQIPGPIPLDSQNASPLVKAAFPDHQDLEKLLHLADTQWINPKEKGQTRVALLTMTHNEKEFLGTARDGQMLVADARLKAVTFSDHKVVGIATNLAESRQRLEQVIFDVIIESAANELADRRADLGELREQREKLKAMLKVFGVSAANTREFKRASGEKIDKVKHYLDETEDNLSEVKTTVETAADRLDFLVNLLSRPENILDIELVSLRLDWSNVITSNPEVSASTITFAQCAIHETGKRDAVLIAYDLENDAAQ